MKILITGSSSFLGKKVRTALGRNYEIISTTHHRTKGKIQLDILNAEMVDDVFSSIRPEVVIHLAGIADPDFCERNPQLAYRVNVGGTENVVRACKMCGARLVFASSDYVFDGNNPPYTEQSEPSPLNIYGKTKAEAEACVIGEMFSDAAIIRLSILYGYNDSSDRTTFISTILKNLEASETIRADNSQVRYPVLLDDVAIALEAIIKRDIFGIFHLAPKSGITKYEWAIKTAEIFQKSTHNIIPVRQTRAVPRPLNAQLVSSRSQELGAICREVEDGIRFIYKQLELCV
ncbi:SDR family oxidoreductase [Candidatus Omnitrophota bacterium]